MKKEVRKKIAFVIIFVLMTLITTAVFAGSDPFAGPTAQKPDGVADTTTNVLKTILFVVQTIGMSVAVIMIIVVAIKYIYSAPDERATLKKQMVVYVVGAVLLFAATGIIELVKTFALKLN